MAVAAAISLGVGLSMDAFAAALGQGIAATRQRRSQALRVGLAFGLAQTVMPLIGWSLGIVFQGSFQAVDHWIAFGLLALIGLHMIRAEIPENPPLARGWKLAALALATSVDAAAAGATIALLKIPVLIACAIIGVITFMLSAGGVLAGSAAGAQLGHKAQTLGGVILIALGTKILIEHLYFG